MSDTEGKSAPAPCTLPFRRTGPDTFELLNRFGEARLRIDPERATRILSDGREEPVSNAEAMGLLASLLTSHGTDQAIAREQWRARTDDER